MYKLKDQSTKEVISFKPKKEMKKIQEVTLKLEGTEYINRVEGLSNFYFIEFIKITTSRGNFI